MALVTGDHGMSVGAGGAGAGHKSGGVESIAAVVARVIVARLVVIASSLEKGMDASSTRGIGRALANYNRDTNPRPLSTRATHTHPGARS